jgi:hypothetical protein
VRETPWGDLHVCVAHARAPLFDESDLAHVTGGTR